MTNYLTNAEVAALAKKELKKAFPSIKFSVKSSRKSDFVHIEWKNGPTREQVESTVKMLDGMGFDGMTDSYFYKDGRLTVDGQECVSTSIISANRSYTRSFIESVLKGDHKVKIAGNEENANILPDATHANWQSNLFRANEELKNTAA